MRPPPPRAHRGAPGRRVGTRRSTRAGRLGRRRLRARDLRPGSLAPATTGGMACRGGPEVSPAVLAPGPHPVEDAHLQESPCPTPRVLVAYATRHDSTAEIAAAIADELDAAGCAAIAGRGPLRREPGPRRRGGDRERALPGALGRRRPWTCCGASGRRSPRSRRGSSPRVRWASDPRPPGPNGSPSPRTSRLLAEEIGAHATTFGGRVDPRTRGSRRRSWRRRASPATGVTSAGSGRWARAIAGDLLARAEARAAADEAPSGSHRP